MPDAPIRILLVEDEVLNRALVRATLTRADDARLREADLVEAPTIADARQALNGGRFDVLLLDVRLPDGDGLELAASLPKPRPLMVALTASVVPSPRDRAAQAGCDGFLEKPFQPSDLQTLLVRLLDGLVPA
ncbi:MAG: response regulator [Chloroflexi bacterium]|nr:MAG: response regulator [Chloroflexota bacterium]